MSATTYDPRRYYSYAELTAYLEAVAEAHPQWCRLERIGESPEGRAIWLMALTDRARGEAEAKPAYWIDGNTHASEVMGSAACLHTIDYVLRNLGEPGVAELLVDRALYVAPRINPDGAEYCLHHEHYVRSARRLYPDPHAAPGLVEEDVDGDGDVLQMRMEAADGAWRVSAHDGRLMLPRRPWDGDDAGPFYHLWAEGHFDEEAAGDPRLPMLEQDPHGLDFNRNYPNDWKPQSKQHGAGPYPLSEPETRAVVEFFGDHPNIGGALTYHTYSGVLLRPFTAKADTEMPAFDLATYELFGARCEELTGFPCKSVFHDFRYDPTAHITGVFDDWVYEHVGVHCYTMELWSPWKHAGLDFSDDFLRFWRGRTEEDELALLRWNDEALDGACFERWRPFDHPQLGPVEIGGWRWMYSFRNAPAHMLPEEVEPSVRFTLDHARALPRPRVELEVEALGDGLFRVEALLRNDGYLPTHITALGRDSGLARPLHLEIELSEGLRLEEGLRKQRVEHLSGHGNTTVPFFGSQSYKGKTLGHLRRHRWLVRGEAGEVTVSWWGDRIGRVEQAATLGSTAE